MDLIQRIDEAIASINRDLQDFPIGYHFTTQIDTKHVLDKTEISISLLAIEDGIPNYHPVTGSDRRELLLVKEGVMITDYMSMVDKMQAQIHLEQRFLTNCMRILLLGVGSPLIVDVDKFERVDGLKLISGGDNLLLP